MIFKEEYRNEPIFESEYYGCKSRFPRVSYKEQPIIYLNSRHSDSGTSERYQISDEDIQSIISLNSAKEHNEGIIDKMLVKARGKRPSSGLNKKRRSAAKYRYHRENVGKYQTSRAIKVGKRSARKSRSMSIKKSIPLSSKKNHAIDEYAFEILDSEPLEIEESSFNKEPKKERKKKRSPIYPSMSTDSELRRKLVFNTVVEIPTNRYAFTKSNMQHSQR